MIYLQSLIEKADTKLILHAIDAATKNFRKQCFLSSYRCVCSLVKAVLNAAETFTLSVGQESGIDELSYCSLCRPLAILSLQQCRYITGRFANKGKLSWWKIFMDANEVTVNALAGLATREQPSIGTMAAVEKLTVG